MMRLRWSQEEIMEAAQELATQAEVRGTLNQEDVVFILQTRFKCGSFMAMRLYNKVLSHFMEKR